MQPIHILMAISIPVIWGLGFTFSKAALNEFPPLMLMGFRFCLTALILVWFVPPPRGEYRRVFQIAMIGSATAAPFMNLVAVFGVLLGIAALGEPFTLRHAVASGLIGVGLVLSQLQRERAPA